MSKPNYLLFLWLLVLKTYDCTYRSANITLPEVVLFITREHLSNLTSTIVIAKSSITKEGGSTNTQLMEYVLQHLDGRIAVQFYTRDYLIQPLEYYMLIVDSLEAFKGIYRMLTDNFYERHFRFLIVLTKLVPDIRKVMEEIFELCFFYDVIDVNIIAEEPRFSVSMFTYFLYQENVCRQCVPVLLNRFNESFENLKNIFPDKLQNFHGCPLKVTGRVFPTFLSFSGNKSNPKPVGAWENLSGIEASLLKFMAHSLNFKIDMQPFPNELSFINDNRTYGCFSELEDHKADIAIGGFSDTISGRLIFSPTSSYYSSPYRYVIRGNKYISSLGRLAKPFSYELWILVACFFFLTVLFTSVLKILNQKVHQFVFGAQNHNPVTNFMSLFLGFSVTRTPRRNFARYVFLHLLFLTLILRNAYQGSLYDAFRMNRFEWVPKGHEDLMKWNYTLFLHPESMLLTEFADDRKITIYSNNYDEILEKVNNMDGRYATIVLENNFIHFLETNIGKRIQIIPLSEVVLNCQFVMFLPKHSIYLSVFNKKLKELAAAGILEKENYDSKSMQKISEKFHSNNSMKMALRNERLLALYIIYVILLGVSLLVFCLEIISFRYKSTWLQRILV